MDLSTCRYEIALSLKQVGGSQNEFKSSFDDSEKVLWETNTDTISPPNDGVHVTLHFSLTSFSLLSATIIHNDSLVRFVNPYHFLFAYFHCYRIYCSLVLVKYLVKYVKILNH